MTNETPRCPLALLHSAQRTTRLLAMYAATTDETPPLAAVMATTRAHFNAALATPGAAGQTLFREN